MRGRLEASKPFAFQAEAGHCYFAVLRLDQEAAPYAKAMQLVFVDGKGEESQGGPGMRGPGGVHSAGCPQKQGKIRVRLDAREPLRGGFEIQIFSKAQSARERKASAKAVQDAHREARESVERDRVRAKRVCAECETERASCIESRPGRCAQAFRVCVERTGFSPASCE